MLILPMIVTNCVEDIPTIGIATGAAGGGTKIATGGAGVGTEATTSETIGIIIGAAGGEM